MQSYYSKIKQTHPPNSPTLLMLEKLREMIVDSGSVCVRINGTKYPVSLREAQEMAKEEGISVKEFIDTKYETEESNETE